MEVTLYLDVYFLANFLADLLLLGIVGRLFRLRRTVLRLVSGALAGAAWACGMTVLFLRLRTGPCAGSGVLCQGAEFLFQIPVPAALMLFISFGRAGPQTFGLRMAVLLAAGVFLGGGLELAAERLGGMHRMSVWLPAALAASAGLRLLLRTWEAFRGRMRGLCRVTLENGDRSVQVTALRDNGNRLFEPYGHRPVHVVNRKVGEALCTRESRAALIPYRSVGRAGGLLLGLRIERMTVETGSGSGRVYERPWIALSAVPVSAEGRYEMLLHSEE